MEAEARGREPARWCMHWAEVSVFDDNATALGIDISDLMGAAGQGLAAQAVRMLNSAAKPRGPVWILLVQATMVVMDLRPHWVWLKTESMPDYSPLI